MDDTNEALIIRKYRTNTNTLKLRVNEIRCIQRFDGCV